MWGFTDLTDLDAVGQRSIVVMGNNIVIVSVRKQKLVIENLL
jgi:hypothetical protein